MQTTHITQAASRESGSERERVKRVMAKMNIPDKGVFFGVNQDNKTAVELLGFACFEEIQGAFRCGIKMPDGTMVNGIGRCANHADFMAKAKYGQWTVLESKAINRAEGK